MSYPAYQLARAFKYIISNTGSGLQLASTTWTEFATWTNGPGADAWDMTLQAEVGDVLEYGINGMWNNDAVGGRLDVATIVSGAIVNTFSRQSLTVGTTYGISAWFGIPSAYQPVSGSAWYTVQASDLEAGYVKLRPYARCDSASTKAFSRAATNPLMLCAKNLGPVDPN